MTKSTKTDDRDPFELGGWNGESATGGAANRAGATSPVAIGMAAQPEVLPAADPPNRSEAMPDGSIATPSPAPVAADHDDPVLAYPLLRLAELDALAKNGDDDACDKFIEMLAELGTLTATTLPGLCAHLVQFARWIRTEGGAGEIAAQNAVAIEISLGGGISRRRLLDVQDRMMLIHRMVDGVEDTVSRPWFNNLVKAFARLVEDPLKPRPSLPDLHARWVTLKNKANELDRKIEEGLPSGTGWPVMMTEAESWAIPDHLEHIVARLKRSYDRSLFGKAERAEKRLAEMRADPERFAAGAAGAQASFDARRVQLEMAVANCGLGATLKQHTAIEAEIEAVLDQIYETPARTPADFAVVLDVCLWEEDEVSNDNLDIDDDDPQQCHSFRLKLFREMMAEVPSFEFFALKNYIREERYQQLFGASASEAEPEQDEEREEELDAAEAERRLAKYPPITLDIEPGEDPEIVCLFQEYVEAERVHARVLALEQEGTEEEVAAQERVDNAVQALGNTPSRSLMGAALKVFALHLFGDEAIGASLYPMSTQPKWPQEEPGIDALNVGFVRDLQRLVPGLSPLIAATAQEDGA